MRVLLLERKGQINAKDSLGKTPLHLAVDGGTTAFCMWLLACRAGVANTDSDDRTPLHVAAG